MSDGSNATVLEFEGFRLDRGRRRLTGPDGADIELKPKVFDTLLALAERPGEVVDKRKLMEAVWPDVVVEENNLNQAISALRKALGDGKGKRLIVTVPGRGYQLATASRPSERPAERTSARTSDDAARAGPVEPVLAVLAFDNLSGDPGLAYFSDGISDEIIQTISRAVTTIGRASSFQFRGIDKSVAKIASQLNATHVLDGTVRRGDGLVRINAQLIEVGGQTTIWQSSYERPMRDLFAVQDEIAVAVASTLRCRLTPPPQSSDIDPETYEIFLRLRQARLDWTLSPKRRLDLADEVTHRAPNFGRGWLEAAQIRASIRRNTGLNAAQSRQLYEEMQEAIAKAEKLLGENDPYLTALVVNWTSWTGAWTECERRLRRALDGAPHVAALKTVRASLLSHCGRLVESLELYQEAQRQEPLGAILAAACGMGLDAARRSDEAFAVYEAALRRWPDNSFIWHCLTTAAAREGRWDIVDKWSAAERVSRLQAHGGNIEAARSTIELYRTPSTARSAALLKKLEDEARETGRLRLVAITEAAQFCPTGSVYDTVDRVSFAYLADPLVGHVPRDLGVQALFLAEGRQLRSDPQFVKLCARLGLVSHWIETGRWPDCADETPYDFRAEAHRVADTPLG